jgi:sugar phosphate isomerase/epimerase
MKFGMIHYNAPGDTLEEFLDYAERTGFDYVELAIGDVWPEGDDSPEKRAEAARSKLDSRGLTVSALHAENEFILLKGSAFKHEIERIRRVARVAQVLGTQMLRIDGGWPEEKAPDEEWLVAIVEGVSRCLEFAVPMDLRLALDNHGIVTNQAEFQLQVLERVDSPNLGLNLDTMNYRWFGHELETVDRYYEMVAPHVIHTHLKDGRGARAEYVGTVLGEGEIHLDHAVASLQRVGYRGSWCAEYEGPRAESAEGYEKCLAWMQAHITG